MSRRTVHLSSVAVTHADTASEGPQAVSGGVTLVQQFARCDEIAEADSKEHAPAFRTASEPVRFRTLGTVSEHRETSLGLGVKSRLSF